LLENICSTSNIPASRWERNGRHSEPSSCPLPGGRVSFVPAILLTKCEVFDACARLSNIERLLAQAGQIEEASWAAAIFEQLEERLAEREWRETNALPGVRC
jgi:hypothetical protein